MCARSSGRKDRMLLSTIVTTPEGWCRLARGTLWMCLCLLAAVSGAAAQAPDRGTVFVRVIGDIKSSSGQDAWLLKEKGLELTNVEVGVGSGFLFSPLGYILTNHHVVTDRVKSATVDGRRIELSVIVRRIEVLFPADTAGDAPLETPAAQEAAVVGSRPDLDLAVLHIGGGGYPFLRLGDSDALERGQAVQVIGFPFGLDVELGKPAISPGVAPQVSLSRGNVAAIRTDTQGQPRYVQTTATLNPGNSGGPMLDDDGYVIGIISRALVQGQAATGVGFAIPVNLAKDFLESQGLEGQLPVRRLVLGPLQRLETKGILLRLPEGMTDVSPRRTLVDCAGAGGEGLVLRIERVVSSWPASRLAEALTTGSAFESLLVTKATRSNARSADVDTRRIVTGRAAATLADGRTPAGLEYAIVELGLERLVARYIGHPDVIAFNASVLRASLASLDGEPLATDRQSIFAPQAWVPAEGPGGQRAAAVARLVMPEGWLQETAAPLPCAGLAAPMHVMSASPSSDFTTVLRAAWLRQPGLTPERAAAACGTRSRTDGAGRYQKRLASFGTPLVVEGAFISVGPSELLQLEAIATAERADPIRSLLSEWIKQMDAR